MVNHLKDIIVQHKSFTKQKLVVRLFIWKKNQLILNGERLVEYKGRYMAVTDDGTWIELKFKKQFDGIPKLLIGDEIVVLARPLTWYEMLWAYLPIILLIIGGAIGGAIGGWACYMNISIMRSELSITCRYTCSSIVTLLSGLFFYLYLIMASGILDFTV